MASLNTTFMLDSVVNINGCLRPHIDSKETQTYRWKIKQLSEKAGHPLHIKRGHTNQNIPLTIGVDHLISCGMKHDDLDLERTVSEDGDDLGAKVSVEWRNVGENRRRRIRHNYSHKPSISDSEEYDTDLEVDQKLYSKDTKPAEDTVAVMTYYKACQDSATPPQRCIINALSTRTLSIRNRSLGPNAIPPICAAYRGNLRVEELTLDSADIGDAGMKHVSKMLINNFTITNVNLSNNNIGVKGSQLIGHVMVITDNIVQLNLSGNQLDDTCAWYLTTGIGNNTSITHLDLSYNTLEEQAGLMLGSSLARNNTLVSLNLSWNKIRGKGAVAIFRALMLNNTVSNLNISWNGLGYEGTVALCKCLKRNTGLLDLDLANNRLNWRCALLLAEGLRSNSTLRNLRVGRNTINTTGAMDILEAVATTGSVIANLDLSDIPVIAEADLLAATISRRREFTFKHGGIVATHDKLGQRVGRELNPMLRIIEYLRLLGLRPLELMKSFDKNASLEMPRKDFVEQIRKIGVNLKPYEVDALANSVSGKGFNKNVINYRKLSMAVREVVEAERERKIRERKEWLQIKSYHENILNKGKVDEYIAQSPSSRSVDPVNALRVKSNETIGLSISRHSTGTSRLVSEVSRVKPALSIAMPAMLTEVKLPGKASKKPKKRSARM